MVSVSWESVPSLGAVMSFFKRKGEEVASRKLRPSRALLAAAFQAAAARNSADGAAVLSEFENGSAAAGHGGRPC